MPGVLGAGDGGVNVAGKISWEMWHETALMGNGQPKQQRDKAISYILRPWRK